MNNSAPENYKLTYNESVFLIKPPYESIKRIIQKLTPVGTPMTKARGTRLSMDRNGEKVCYILLSGYVSFCSLATNKTVAYVYPEAILGLTEILTTTVIGHFRVEEDCALLRVSLTDLQAMLGENHDLWQDITYFLCFMVQRMYARDASLNGATSYEVIKSLLMDLNMQPTEIKVKTNVSKYIMERVVMSRSNIMSVLSQLQKGGYIEIENGCMVSLKALPAKW
ncbi:MAG: helix-turn-helix domain-containing protein [Silvania sp.]